MGFSAAALGVYEARFRYRQFRAGEIDVWPWLGAQRDADPELFWILLVLIAVIVAGFFVLSAMFISAGFLPRP